MKEVELDPLFISRIKKLYQEMEASYDIVASQLGFSCNGCTDNCCDSYFLHHTYAEWGYLWYGFKQLTQQEQQELIRRSQEYITGCKEAESEGQRPQVLCPLNENGLCGLYPYRLMVCRTHGVPAVMTRPDGQSLSFPGCFRCQELVDDQSLKVEDLPRMERTKLLSELVKIENDLFAGKRHLYPKVRLTIAEMLVIGAPTISTPHCERPR